MKVAILYGSTHGTTKRIIKKLSDYISFEYDIFNVKDISVNTFLLDYELLFFICPTYGDEELQDDMEEFLKYFKFDLSSKKYVICETGNYYGYDNFEFGAKKIIDWHLRNLGATEYYPGFSLDTLPKIDWESFEKWFNNLNSRIVNA